MAALATSGGGIKFGTSGGRNARLNRVRNEKKRREKGRDKEKKCTLSKPKFKERERGREIATGKRIKREKKERKEERKPVG